MAGGTQRRGAATSIDLMSLAPVRSARWGVKEDGRVVVERPRPATRGLRGLLDRLSHLLSMRFIRLDAAGSVAWRHLDGSATVRQVGERMDAELEGDEGERAGAFVAQLHRLELVALPGVDDGETLAAARTGEGAAGPTLEFGDDRRSLKLL